MPLSAKTAVFDAYRWLFGGGSAFLALAWKPVALAAMILVAIVLLGAALDLPRVKLLASPLLLAVGSAFAVAWHRRVLLGEARPETRRGRIGRYAGFVCLFTFCWALALATAWLGAALMGYEEGGMRLLAAVIGIITLYLVTRLVTLFPAIALDRKQSASEAWRATRGHGMRLGLGVWFAVLPLVILSRLISEAVKRSEEDDLAGVLVGNMVAQLIFFATIAIAAGYASSVFRQTGALGAGGSAPSV
jgi:hypothetical protein